MKKINIISILLAVLTLVSSCNTDEAGLNPPEQGDRTVTVTAAPAQTKTALDGGEVKWEDGDAISLRFTHPTAGPAMHQFSTGLDAASVAADFTGTLPLEVYREESGYQEAVLAVYPEGALTAEGEVSFTLPAEQKVRGNGTFAKGLNLASASVSLADIRDDGNASATFRNALSILRFSVADDVTSVTLTGTSPLAGKAPLAVAAEGDDEGRLVIDGEWAEGDKSMSVTLKPADGSECLPEGEVNMLVWPGLHSSMSVTVNFKEYGEFSKSKTFDFEFLPSRYYTLDLNADSDELVTDITDRLDAVEGDLDDLENRLAALETSAERISMLVNQIQSVALVTEYLDNAVHACYATSGGSLIKDPASLDFKVRPAKAMELLLEECDAEGTLSDVLSGSLRYGNGGLNGLTVTDAVLEGDILSVELDAAGISDSFYYGGTSASLALEISDGNTEILSDFAKLVPKTALAMSIPKSEGLPVLRGAEMTIQFQYGSTNVDNVKATIEDVKGFDAVPRVSLGSATGSVYASFDADDDVSEMGFTLVLTDTETQKTKSVPVTFEDVGDFDVVYWDEIEWVGEEVSVTFVDPQNGYDYRTNMYLSNGSVHLKYAEKVTSDGFKYEHFCNDAWAYETYAGAYGKYTVEANQNKQVEVSNPDWDSNDPDSPRTKMIWLNDYGANYGVERSFYVTVTVETTDPGIRKYSYTRTVKITQKAEGAEVDETKYYHNGDYELIDEADAAVDAYLNLVIVGDGYTKKDLRKGGAFEEKAMSACNAFFGVEPYSSFRDRFNVYMMPFESQHEGPRLGETANGHSTYFGTWYHGSGNTYVNYDDEGETKVMEAVQNTLGITGADLYRTVVILLVNTDESLGSTNYPYQAKAGWQENGEYYEDPGDGYATFSIAILASKSTATGGLVRHEAGGHAFGRLGDEYGVDWYTPSLVEERHAVGFYRNIAVDAGSYWQAFTDAGYDVLYDPYKHEKATSYLYRSTHESGIMWNNNGQFNAVSRHIIYERIIKQTESADAYSWEKFLEYDKRNL